MKTLFRHTFSISFLILHILGIQKLCGYYVLRYVFAMPMQNIEKTTIIIAVLAIAHAIYLFFAFKFKLINKTFVTLYWVIDTFFLGAALILGQLFSFTQPDDVLQKWNENGVFLMQNLLCVGGIVLRSFFSVLTLRFLRKTRKTGDGSVSSSG